MLRYFIGNMWCFVATQTEYRQWFCIEYFTQWANTCASSWMHKSKLKLKFVCPEKKWSIYDVQRRRNGNPGPMIVNKRKVAIASNINILAQFVCLLQCNTNMAVLAKLWELGTSTSVRNMQNLEDCHYRSHTQWLNWFNSHYLTNILQSSHRMTPFSERIPPSPRQPHPLINRFAKVCHNCLWKQ